MNEKEIRNSREISLKVEILSPPIYAVIGSTLALIDGVKLNILNRLLICPCLIDIGDGLDDDYYGVSDTVNYNSDGYLPH